ncbi:MFS transporter [Alphaproteobacteria bacterium]|jgi:MFS family permease|nr:MFS transporter [Alphaproteobacteria bacterium]MDB2683913.1 MFS transporter [Alphaproteobacteria bacterium]MDC3410133.1 MFS transporter [Alphaproteobacteria bacterium]
MKEYNSSLISPVLIAGCLIIIVTFGIRGSFGVFQIPIENEFQWLRVEFSLAIAIQNLGWGIGAPIFGALGEKFGDRKMIIAGSLCYVSGLILSTFAQNPLTHQFLELIIGFGIAGTGMGMILAVVGRASSEKNRSMALGIVTAAGSVGQMVGAPLAQTLVDLYGWQQVFIIFAFSIVLVMSVVPLLKETPVSTKKEIEVSLTKVLGNAFKDPNFSMIFLGFFACGYQLAFVSAHFPAMVTEMCSAISPSSLLQYIGVSTTSSLGALGIAVIGFSNIFGTIYAGWLGQKFPKKYLLAIVYALRTLIGLLFIIFPITPMSVVLFSFFMGSLWLATVPLTSGLIAHIYGLRYMGTLYGLVFLSHQLGSFLGVWMGGKLYDTTGDYTLVWWIGVGVSAFSAIIHLPIKEKKLQPA